MTLQVLISCMHQHDRQILVRSNVTSDAVVINQCDRDSREEFEWPDKNGDSHHIVWVDTTERGLSRSRNMALSNATADVCLICDDDELLADNLSSIILSAYRDNPGSSVVVFAVLWEDGHKTYPQSVQPLGFKQTLKSSSHQITFKRNSIMDKGISFDEKMGSGTGNGGGEEIKFLMDCRRAGFKMWYHPTVISEIKISGSQWFHGYDEKFMLNQGWSSRRILGPVVGLAYIIYWWLSHYKLYSKTVPLSKALRALLKGYKEVR